jgi:TolA-binding protein
LSRRDRHGEREEDRFVKGAFSFIDYVTVHRSTFITIGVFVVCGILGLLAYRAHIRSYNENATIAFEGAKQAEDFMIVADSYPGSSVEPLARFYYGRKLLEQKKIKKAGEVFSSFPALFPQSYLLPHARVLAATIAEEQGDYNRALDMYAALIEDVPDFFMAPRLLINMGTCNEKLGRWDAATAAYERIIADYAESPWKDEAEQRVATLQVLKGKAAEKTAEESPAKGETLPAGGVEAAPEEQAS